MSFDLPNQTTHMTANTSMAKTTQNEVLRQTYTLLAVSLIPTMIGAAIGVYTPLAKMMMMSPLITMVMFLAATFGLMYMVEKNSTSSTGVAWLMAFTFFMGLMLSRIISRTLGYSNGGELIMLAMGGTAAIFAAMATVAGMIKRDLSGMGKFLMISSIVLLVAGIASMFLNIPGLYIVLTVICLVLFSAYLMYDLNQIIQGGETNYIRATLSVYLNVYNIFSSLLSLLGLGGNRD